MSTNRNYYTMIIALLAGLKLIAEALFGVKLADGEYDTIVNAVSAIFAVAGIIMTHLPSSTATTPAATVAPATEAEPTPKTDA